MFREKGSEICKYLKKQKNDLFQSEKTGHYRLPSPFRNGRHSRFPLYPIGQKTMALCYRLIDSEQCLTYLIINYFDTNHNTFSMQP
jgi:hypothetical protein